MSCRRVDLVDASKDGTGGFGIEVSASMQKVPTHDSTCVLPWLGGMAALCAAMPTYIRLSCCTSAASAAHMLSSISGRSAFHAFFFLNHS